MVQRTRLSCPTLISFVTSRHLYSFYVMHHLTRIARPQVFVFEEVKLNKINEMMTRGLHIGAVRYVTSSDMKLT